MNRSKLKLVQPIEATHSLIYDPATTLIRIDDVIAKTSLSRSSIYRKMEEGKFPRPVSLSDSTARGSPKAWRLSEVQAWIQERTALRDGINSCE